MQPMGDHLILPVDPVVMESGVANLQESLIGDSDSNVGDLPTSAVHVEGVGECEEGGGEGENLIEKAECRICQDEDCLRNLDIPCACKGTLKFAHKRCVKLWCYEKGDTICEICHQPFSPEYTVLSALYHHEDTSIDINEGWQLPRNPLSSDDPRLLAIAAAQNQVLEAEHDHHVHIGFNGTTFCQFSILILMVLFLLRHASPLFNAEVEITLNCLYLFFLYAAAVVLPCFIMVWIVRIIWHQRQRQPAAAEFTIMLPAEEQRGHPFIISPGLIIH